MRRGRGLDRGGNRLPRGAGAGVKAERRAAERDPLVLPVRLLVKLLGRAARRQGSARLPAAEHGPTVAGLQQRGESGRRPPPRLRPRRPKRPRPRRHRRRPNRWRRRSRRKRRKSRPQRRPPLRRRQFHRKKSKRCPCRNGWRSPVIAALTWMPCAPRSSVAADASLPASPRIGRRSRRRAGRRWRTSCSRD